MARRPIEAAGPTHGRPALSGERAARLQYFVQGPSRDLETDGPTHQGRAAADKSRDHFFENSGAAYLDRSAVEDSTDDATLDEHVERSLKRLVS
jgi:hypothetical protein